MANESFIIEIDGEEAAELYEDLVELSVEVPDDGPATFQLTLALYKDPEGGWVHLDEERLRLWREVVIHVGFVDGGPEELIRGYITQVRPHFDREEGRSILEVAGMDGSVLMDRQEKLKDWPNKKDSDIARELFGEYGFTPDVEDTAIIHDEALSTVIQRETDYRFLRRLALRNGLSLWVEGGVGHFLPLPADPEPQPVLAAHFGEETNLLCFTATVDAMHPSQVEMFQVDRLTKEVLTAGAVGPVEDPLGSLAPDDLLPPGEEPARVYVAKNAATGMPEMTALVEGLFREGSWFVSAEGEVDPAAYAHVLRPRGLVTVKGVGESYSGVYYVSFVRHTITREGYSQLFRARRDALLPTDDEDFSSDGGLGDLL